MSTNAEGTILVTGGTGFIGQALVKELSSRGNNVVCLVREGSTRRARIEGLPRVTIKNLASLSLVDVERALVDIHPRLVFHLASAGVKPAERDPEALIEGNVALTARLLVALESRRPERFVHIGSCSEVGKAHMGERIREDHPLLPTSTYGAAKAAAYLCGQTIAAEKGIPFVPLRLFGVYGPGEGDERLLPHLFAHFASGTTPSLTPGDQLRDFTYIDDVIRALLLAAESKSIEPFRVYNVCSGIATEVAAMAIAAAIAAGKPSADLGLGRRPHRADEAMWVVGDPSRFQEATGYRPEVSLEQGIKNAYAYFSEQSL